MKTEKSAVLLWQRVLTVLFWLLLIFTHDGNGQAVYQGTLTKQIVTIVTNSRCSATVAMTTDTVKAEYPPDRAEFEVKHTFCGLADFSGKLVYTLPKTITAILKDDSVLVFQSPAKATISASINGSGTWYALIDTITESSGVGASVTPMQGGLIGGFLDKCPNFSVNDSYWPKVTGSYSLSAAASCSEVDFLLGFPQIYSAKKDTLVSMITVGASFHSSWGPAIVPDILIWEKATHKIFAIIGWYQFVKQDSLEEVEVWQEVPFYADAGAFSSNKNDYTVKFDTVSAEVITAAPESIVVRVPAGLVGDRSDITRIPDQKPRPVVAEIRMRRLDGTVATGSRRFRFIPPRLLLYDEVTRANPPLLQETMPRVGPRWRQAFMFLGDEDDGTAAVRLLNTSTKLAPLVLQGKVISPPKPPNYPRGELFDKSNDLNYGNLLNIGIHNAGIQFPVSQNGWYLIIAGATPPGGTGGSPGPFPSMYQIHLAGNAGLPRKLINGQPEFPRAIRLDTYFNHSAPRTETLVNAGPAFGKFAETGLFKFANPVEAAPFAIAVLIPPAGVSDGFPFGVPPVRSRGPAVAGQFPNLRNDPSTPMAQSPDVLDPERGVVIDAAQVPIPASVVAAGPPGGVAAILGSNDGNNLTLPYKGINTVIVDMGSGQEIIDASDSDLRIHCTGGSCTVAVSNTPFSNTFVTLGNASGVQDFNLNGSGLTLARYVRISTSSTASIDAVQALNFLADRFESYGPVGDVASATITMRRNKASSNALDALLELIGPDGSAMGKNESSFGDDTSLDKSDAALTNKDLNQAGFYRFLGRGYDTQPDEQAFGTFYARLETGGTYDPVELAVSSANEVSTTAQKKAKITQTRQRDSYLFQAAPGSTVRIVVNGIDSDALPDPMVELYDPEDFLIAANDDYTGRGKRAALEITLPKNGRSGSELPNPSTYRLVVMGIDSHTGTSTSSHGSKAYIRKVNGGQYELKVFTGALENSSPVLQPQIATVSPAIFAPGAMDQMIILTGQNFSADAAVSFSRSGVVVKSLTVVNATEIHATITIGPSVALGSCDVTVSQGAGLKATSVNAIQIKASLGKIALSWQPPPDDGSMAPPSGLNAKYGSVGLQRKLRPNKSLNKKFILPSHGSRHSSMSDVMEVEPNNDLTEAQVLPTDTLVTVQGAAEVADEGSVKSEMDETTVDDIEDLYRIEITTPGVLVLLFFFERDCDLYLLDSMGEIIDYSLTTGNDAPEFLELPELAVGKYYLGVSIYDPELSSQDATPYMLEIYTETHQTNPTVLTNYHIYRSTTPDAKNSGRRVATVPASVTQYDDPVLANGTAYYQVTAEYDQGESAPSNEAQIYATRVDDRAPITVAGFKLHQNHPNPFNPMTSIGFSLPAKDFVTLKVFDVLGKNHTTLVEQIMDAGEHNVSWYAGDLPTGIYIARLQSRDQVQQIKMMLIK